LIFFAVFAAYFPALNGGLIWDDAAHITPPELRSVLGLWRTWFELGATQQYYPVLHSAFWFEHRLWGDATVGYHLLNVLFHGTAACLVAVILRRLAVPGAWLAAAIFALHPVHVESVAWMSEQKNTLSAVFYLSAALVYLHFDQKRRPALYGLGLGLFALGLMTKSVIATLPAALLVILWRRARQAGVEARCVAAGAVAGRRGGSRTFHRVGGTHLQRCRGGRLPVHAFATGPAGGAD